MQKDFLQGDESIFLNDIALDYNFIPSVLLHREGQQAYIGNCIKLLEQNKNGRNLFIFGDPGIGKTLATRYVLKQVEENSDEIMPVYINCWKKITTRFRRPGRMSQKTRPVTRFGTSGIEKFLISLNFLWGRRELWAS